MFHHILFPIDFSERCKEAVPFVQALAHRYRAKVTLMHVIQIPSGWYGGMDTAYPIVFDVDAMERDARRQLAAFYGSPDGPEPGSFSTHVVTRTEPGRAIVQYAEQSQADLIMMPTHGYGTFRRFLLGSVTAQVLHDAHCPVWTAVHTQDQAASRLEHRQILCAVDTTEKSIPIIHRAVGLAEELAATLRLVHAVPYFDADLVAPVADGARFFLDAARRQIQALQRKAGTNLEVCMETGSVSAIVRHAALHHEADLVVIGRGHIPERLGGLRTNAYAIIRDSPCPVLSV